MRIICWILFYQLTLGAAALAQEQTVPVLPPISSPPSGEQLPGKFVWADLFSNDVEASRSFYEQVFGWEWRQIKAPPEPYGVFYQSDRPVAGLAYRQAPDGGENYGRWIHYVSVDDVAALEQAIVQRKGRVLLKHRSFPDRGQFAVVADIHGAPFGIIRSSSGDPGDYRAPYGEWIWHELFTRDLGEAILFYTDLFAYESEREEQNREIMQYLLTSHGFLRAGIGSLAPDSDTAPTWLGYVRVEDIEKALKRALANGAKVLVEPQSDIANGGLAIVTDPTGAPVGLLQWEYGDERGKEMQP